MIAVKATHVEIEGVRRTIKPPASHGLLHDEDGRAWPRCSVLIGPFRKTSKELESPPGWVKRWFGRGYAPKEGYVTLPPKDLSAWKVVDDAHRVYYDRRGVLAPGYYQHPFDKPRIFDFIRKKQPVVVYRHGSFLRLELPSGCIFNWRGFVYP